MIQKYIILILLWILYFFLHSFLASGRVKGKFEDKFGKRKYRLFYVSVSVIGLLFIILFLFTIPSEYLFPPEGAAKFAAYVLGTVGVIIISQAFKHYNSGEFLGLREGSDDTTFYRDGILNYVRHPLYLGTILITLGLFLFSPRLPIVISNICIYIYLIIGIILEEKKLIELHGEEYRKYKEEVPSIIPRLRRK